MSMTRGGVCLVLQAALALLCSNQAYGQYGAGAGIGGGIGAAGAADNARLVGENGDEAGPVSVWLAHARTSNVVRSDVGARGAYDSLGALFNLVRERRRLQAGVTGNLEFRHYADDVIEDERVGAVGAFANATVVPERFTWSFQESYVQGRTDPLGADTPRNRENVSVFSTRPQLGLPLGARTSLIIAGTYSDRKYTESELFDSDALTYEAGILRRASTTTTFGLTAQRTEIEYEEELAGYDIEGIQVNYDRQLASGRAHVAVGRNSLVLGNDKSAQPLLQLTWTRSLTLRSNLSIAANRGFIDAGQLFQLEPGQSAIGPTDVLLSGDASDQRRLTLAYSLMLPRMDVVLRTAAFEDDFERDTALTSRGREVSFELTRRLTAVMSVGAGVQKESRDFSIEEHANDDTYIRLWLNRRLGRRLTLDFHIQRNERAGIGAFDEDSYQIGLVYSPRRQD